jgi:hypothetical protein
MRLIEPQSLFKDQPINKTVVEIINHYSKRSYIKLTLILNYIYYQIRLFVLFNIKVWINYICALTMHFLSFLVSLSDKIISKLTY